MFKMLTLQINLTRKHAYMECFFLQTNNSTSKLIFTSNWSNSYYYNKIYIGKSTLTRKQANIQAHNCFIHPQSTMSSLENWLSTKHLPYCEGKLNSGHFWFLIDSWENVLYQLNKTSSTSM